MVIYRSTDRAVHSASRLKKYDQAFLKRSNGLWTCLVLAYRGMQPAGASSLHWYTRDSLEGAAELEEAMLFVIYNNGATKIVRRRY